MYVCQYSWSHCLFQWVDLRHIYWQSCLILAHELIGVCSLYVAFEGHISFWHIHTNNMFPVTCCWWCHQWHHCICHVKVSIYGYYMPFCVSASTNPDIIVMFYWWCNWCHVILLLIGSQYQSSHVAFHFDNPNLRNSMIPFMMPLASCDTNANGIIWPKMSCSTSFHSSSSKNFNCVIDDVFSIMLHQC